MTKENKTVSKSKISKAMAGTTKKASKALKKMMKKIKKEPKGTKLEEVQMSNIAAELDENLAEIQPEELQSDSSEPKMEMEPEPQPEPTKKHKRSKSKSNKKSLEMQQPQESMEEEKEEHEDLNQPNHYDFNVQDAKPDFKQSGYQGNNQEGTRLHIANISPRSTEQSIKDFFNQNELEIVDIFLPKHNSFTRYAYVEFDSAEAAARALELSGSTIDTTTVTMTYAKPRNQKPPQNRNVSSESCILFVKGLGELLSDQQKLNEMFSDATDVRIPRDQDGQPKGSAYVEYSDPSSAKEMKCQLESQSYYVDFARPREPNFSSNRGSSRRGFDGGRGRYFGDRRGRGFSNERGRGFGNRGRGEGHRRFDNDNRGGFNRGFSGRGSDSFRSRGAYSDGNRRPRGNKIKFNDD